MKTKTKTKAERLIKTVEEILEKEPKGLINKEIGKIIKEKDPELLGSVWNLRTIIKNHDTQIFQYKKGGPYFHKKFSSNTKDEDWEDLPNKEEKKEKPKKSGKIDEEDFYKPFAKYIEGTDECSRAVSFGGKHSNSKWNTPDVLGVYKPMQFLGFQYPYEIITAEIKTKPEESITAFGQAVAYRLFSHKVFLVLPDDIDDKVKKRIKSLCILFGIGLVLFNKNKKKEKDKAFKLIVRAQKNEPDMFFVHEFFEKLSQSSTKKLFNDLIN